MLPFGLAPLLNRVSQTFDFGTATKVASHPLGDEMTGIMSANSSATFAWKPDGTRLLGIYEDLYYSNQTVHWDLSVPFDLSTRGSIVFGPVLSRAMGNIQFRSDGMFVSGHYHAWALVSYTLSTPWDWSTVSTYTQHNILDNSFDIPMHHSSVLGDLGYLFYCKTDDTNGSARLVRYNYTWGSNGVSNRDSIFLYQKFSGNFYNEMSHPFFRDPRTMYIMESDTGTIYEGTMTADYDINSLTDTGRTISGIGGRCREILMDPNQRIMFLNRVDPYVGNNMEEWR